MSSPIAEILSQGDEVVGGEIVDTNAAWLARRLTGLGFELVRHTTVGDDLEALTAALGGIAKRAELCLSSGGLGPTCDDLTAEAASRAFDLPLALDPVALAGIEAHFARLGRPMAAINAKQAWLPRGAERLDNLWGTAPGFALTVGRCRLVFLPGVPGEMKAMFRHWVEPDLRRRFALRPARSVVLHTVGVGEATLQERLAGAALPAAVRLGFRALGTENQVKLQFPADFPDSEVERAVLGARRALGQAVYAVGSGADVNLERVVGRRLAALKARLFIVETVSGGALVGRCAGRDWLAGALVLPSPEGLPTGLELGTHSACSPLVAAEQSGADYVLVQGGAALGPNTVEGHFTLFGRGARVHETRVVGGEPSRRRHLIAALTLDFLRRRLEALVPGERAPEDPQASRPGGFTP